MTKPTITTSAITSEELNFLIFRYLQESGFTHASFALGYEGGINKSHIDGNLIPPGALVTIVQKGLQYIELEANLDDVNPLGSDEYSHLQPLDIITKNVSELQNIIKDKKNKLILEHDDGRDKEKDMKERDKETSREKEKVAIEKEQEREKEKDKQQEEHNNMNNKEDTETSRKRPRIDENGCSAETMDASIPTSPSIPHVISSSEVTILEGHTSEVFACAWSPTGPLLASGSGDSTARIWTVPDSTCGSNAQTQPSCVQILKHYKGKLEKSKDVTTLDWNGEGSLLATGSYDGQARIWSTDGELKATLIRHKGPIFSLKWNKKGDYLLSGSVDKTAIVWDTRTWECKQQFECHSAPTLDVDWRNNTSFAACSTDSSIHVCKIGENNAVKQFKGHKGEVNAIKWDPTGVLLASCSDDTTAKIWSLKHDKYIHDFRAHQREIYTIKWSPTGLGTCNASQQLLLASASFDSTIKLWEVEQGRLVHSLNGHRQPVYAVAFSPNGQHLASGSLDQCLNIWSVKEGKLIRTYSGGGGIFEVCWNKEGNKIAACFSNSTVMVMDFRM